MECRREGWRKKEKNGIEGTVIHLNSNVEAIFGAQVSLSLGDNFGNQGRSAAAASKRALSQEEQKPEMRSSPRRGSS